MLEDYIIFLLIGSSIIFFYRRLRVLMHFFQQEEYDNERFLNYSIKGFRLIDKKFSLVLLFLTFLNYVSFISSVFFLLSSFFIVSIFSYLERNPCKRAKKVLSITMRVKRILSFSLLILFIALIAFLMFFNLRSSFILGLLIICIIQILPLILISSNIVLTPFEKKIQNRYLKEAKKKMADLQPMVIGITGSYGKTSVKHILYHILSSVFPTLKTPGSVNTQMGITRIIREELREDHKYFIVEMGAYGRGSIECLCELTPPHYGIITCVGNAHYERFKSIENVARAKFELNKSVKDQKGYTFVNADGIEKRFIESYGEDLIHIGKGSLDQECTENSFLEKFYKQTPKNIKDSYLVSDIKQTKEGLQFKIVHKGEEFFLKVPLHGIHHVENIALCFALAQKIGIDPYVIVAALCSVPQIKHRLEVIKSEKGPTIIDDAYNSNPIGFSSALLVLNTLKKDDGRRILVTPGMVELGEIHDEKHRELGKEASKCVDVVLVISPGRIRSFIDSFEKNMNENQRVYQFNTFAEAKEWIKSNIEEKDTVLYENDLPDLYESVCPFA